jgi:hypothetical protein
MAFPGAVCVIDSAQPPAFVLALHGSCTHARGAQDAMPDASDMSTLPGAASGVSSCKPVMRTAPLTSSRSVGVVPIPTLPEASTSSPRVASANGVGVSGWRGRSVVKFPLPAGERRSTSSQRPLLVLPNAPAPKSIGVVTTPSSACSPLCAISPPIWLPPEAAS